MEVEVIDDLVTDDPYSALSARQGSLSVDHDHLGGSARQYGQCG